MRTVEGPSFHLPNPPAAAAAQGFAGRPPQLMPPRPNPLLTAGEFLVAETERSESFNALEHLFEGSLEAVEQRWAATAVLDNAGAWHIVRSSEHVQGETGSRRVKLYSGGSFGR